MLGDFDDAVLLQHDVFGEHAVDGAAQRRCAGVRSHFAAGPALEEAAGHLVAGLDARDAGTNLDHLAGAVGKRNEIFAHRHAVGTANDAEVAEIERAGGDLQQHLTVKCFGVGRSTVASASIPAPPWVIDTHACVLSPGVAVTAVLAVYGNRR